MSCDGVGLMTRITVLNIGTFLHLPTQPIAGTTLIRSPVDQTQPGFAKGGVC